MSSASCFNLDQSKILIIGNGLIGIRVKKVVVMTDIKYNEKSQN